MMDTTPPTARAPSPLWRIGLAIGLLATAGLLLALWPFLRALAAALTEWSGLLGIALALFGIGLLAGGLWIVAAYALRLTAHARQAAILRLPGDLPIHVGDVRQIAVQEAHFALDRHYAAQLAEAERATPLLTSQNQHIHIEGATPPAIEAAAAPQLTSNGSTLAQLRQVGHVCRSGNSLLVGYSAGQPQYIELAECGFVGIGGKPRVGKSTTTLLMIEQAILSGWHVFVGDPHIHKADGLLNRCKPFSGRLAKQATTPDEIAAMIYLADKIGRRRVQGDGDRTPVILVIDEFTNLVWRDEFPADIYRILPSMAIEYAGVGVHGVIISHDYSRAGLGNELGAALRRSFTHRLAHRMDPGNVEFLLPKGSAAQARAISGLETGQALYHSPDGATMIAVPLLTGDDAEYAAQGTPPRPYAPRPQLAAAPAPAGPLPPTARVAPVVRQPAPPTVPFAYTVQEEILTLLGAQPERYMTASEIAAALRIDLQVARTETSALASAGRLTQRKLNDKRTKERIEYAINESTNKPVNALAA